MTTMTVLWISYLSLVNIGQTFMRFQWDQLLLEVGFLSIFVSPLSSSKWAGPRSIIAMELVRWLMFRLMFASGVVKLTSGCPLWWSLNALPVHYESQCLPTRPAWWLYQLPKCVHQFSVIMTFVIEIALPFLFYAPFKQLRRIAAYGQVLLMLMIIITGNYNFFNILTIVLALSVVDEELFLPVKPLSGCNHVGLISAVSVGSLGIIVHYLFPMTISDDWSVQFEIGFSYSQFVDFVYYATIASILLGGCRVVLAIWKQIFEYSSYGRNFIFSVFAMLLFLLSLPSYSTINTEVHQSIWPELHKLSDKVSSFNIVGSYGLFRRMTGADGRPELILEGADKLGGPWQELEFKFKPGNVRKPNKFTAYLQPRLDWQMWFAALSDYQHNPWLISLVYRILIGEKEVYRLMDMESFSDFSPAKPPKYVRGTLYTYRYAPIRNDTIAFPDIWWEREIVSEYFQPLSADDGFLLAYLKRIQVIGNDDVPSRNIFLSGFLDLIWLYMQLEVGGVTLLMWGYFCVLLYIVYFCVFLTYR
ncbi:lipase maturation factor 2-like isoform X2 [Artemia franciscana]